MTFEFIKEQIKKSEDNLKTIKDYSNFLDDLYDMIDKLEYEIDEELDNNYDSGYTEGYTDGLAEAEEDNYD